MKEAKEFLWRHDCQNPDPLVDPIELIRQLLIWGEDAQNDRIIELEGLLEATQDELSDANAKVLELDETNDELEAANSDLRAKVDALEEASSDLQDKVAVLEERLLDETHKAENLRDSLTAHLQTD